MKKKTMARAAAALLSVCMLTTTAFAEVGQYPTTFAETPGVVSGNLAARGMYYADYSSLAEHLEAANDLHLQMTEEGQTLLKNENDALPLKDTERRVTMLGIASIDYNRGGGGSGNTAGTSYKTDWVEAFTQAGFKLNPKTIEMYESLFAVAGGKHEANDSGKVLEPDMSYYGKSVTSTFRSYNDAAIVFISRFGRENMDVLTNSVPGHANEDDHYLQLDDNEHELIKLAKANFDKVIVIVNSSNIMQIPELNASTETEYGVDAILWVGGIGDQGAIATAEILKGEVNPSGHTVDIWPADFHEDPTFTNNSNMTQNKDENGERMTSWFVYPDGTPTVFSSVEFREGIYYGYRYYETKAADEGEAGEAWYQDAVTYPFGHGLSYTTFNWTLAGINAEKTITSNQQMITISVEVENTGKVAGKDVVQIYNTAPYTAGGIEKSAAVLIGYAKTGMLQPGEKEVVTVSVMAQELASFDSEDMNNNGFYGWELEAGNYVISARRNSHDVVLAETFTVAEDIQCPIDPVSGREVAPVFVDDDTTVRTSLEENMLVRSEGLHQPAAQTAEERVLEDWEAAVLDSEETYYPYNDEEGQPWYVSEVPAGWTQGAERTVTEAELAGMVYTEPTVIDGVAVASDDAISQKWDAYMNSLTWDELYTLVVESNGASEGPVQIRGGTCWQSAPITAATWNQELVRRQGVEYANYCLLSGLYAFNGTACNIHRTPFNGRNFEYYSEDPMLSGTCAAIVVSECIQKGVINYAKHFFANVQEHNRADYGGVCTFATEQTFREIYMKSFEMMVKAGSLGLMTSFNRLGYIVNSNSWAVHETLLRDQWGFTGATVTDAWCRDFNSVDLMVRAGDDILLSGAASFTKTYLTYGEWDESARDGRGMIMVPNEDGDGMIESPTHWFAVRKSAQRKLQANINSNKYKNFSSSYELSAKLYAGLVNDANIVCDATSDFTVTLAEGQELPAGLELNGFAVSYFQPIMGQYQPGDPEYKTGRGVDNNIYGEYPAQGTYEVLVDLSCDGYISAQNVPLTIEVVSPFLVNGEDVTDSSVITIKSGEAAELVINSEALAYQAHLTKASAPQVITNWYIMNGTRYLRNEEKTHADGTTIDIKDAEEFHILTYTVDGEIPGLTVAYTEGTAYGQNTAKAITVNTGAVLSGVPTVPGTYTITVTEHVPYAAALAGIWLMPSLGGEKDFTQTITIVVE